MPKRYLCEFCQKSFQDTPVARRRHLQGAGHQRNRRLHYDSFSNAGRGVQQQRADILYSGLSGEEILQQWLSSHPDVVERYEEEKGRRRRREGVEVTDGKSANQTPQSSASGPSLSQTGRKDLLPPYLEPYRGVLPPSLIPPSARTNFPHTLLPGDVSGWG